MTAGDVAISLIRVTGSAAGDPVPATVGRAARRRVLVVTIDFPPSRAMGAQACAQLARHLPRHGWDPIILTVRDRHIEDRDASAAPVSARAIVRTGVIPHPLTLYRRLARRRPGTGAAGPGDPSSSEGRVLRRWALSLLRIPDAYSGWIPPAVIAGLAAIRNHRVDHIFSSSPHSTNHLVGLALATLSGRSWTAQFRDPWTYPWAQWRQSKPLSAVSARIERALERMVLRRADVVACVTDRHTQWLRHVYPDVPGDKLVTIPNGFDGAEWETLEGESPRGSVRNDKFVIRYAGSLYHRRSPAPLFQALGSLIDAGEVARERVRVELIGRCDTAQARGLTDLAVGCGLAGCVELTGPFGRAETLWRMVHADLLLLLAEELTHQIPGKTYEYLRAGRPILALTSEGAVADLLRRTGGAWVVDPGDAAGVMAAVREAYRHWRDGRGGPRPDPEVVLAFDRRLLAGRFAELFDRAVAGSG
jgi:hypothetical protein